MKKFHAAFGKTVLYMVVGSERKRGFETLPNKQNAQENYRIFPNTQPAVIEEQVFKRAQELGVNKRRHAKQAERQGLFSGLLCCANCGSKLHYALHQRRNLKIVCPTENF